MTRQADLKRRVRARMAMTGESYAAARAQVVAGRDRPGQVHPVASLHVTNGDVTVDLLRRAGLARSARAWAHVLHEGPVPPGLDGAGLRRARAEFLAGAYVLWFEADLYDQLQIAQILAMLGDLEVAPDRITLICIGEYPGIAHFGGLASWSPSSSRACSGWPPR